MKARLALQAIWAASGQAGQALVGLVSLLILVRLLGPDAYGIFALGLLFTGLAELLCGGHLAELLVKRKTVERGHENAAFWLSLGVSVLCAVVLVALAQLAADLFSTPDLALVLPAMAALPVLSALAVTPNQLLIRRLQFNSLALADLTSSLCALAVGLTLALNGGGIWSLVFMEMARRTVVFFCNMVSARWLPGFGFARAEAIEIVRFAAKRLENRALQYGAQQAMPRIVIGGLLGTEALGIYAVARRLIDQLNHVLITPIAAVAFPAAAQIQDDRPRLHKLIEASIRITTWVFWPALLGAAVVGMVAFPLVLGAEWGATVVVFQFLVLAALRAPVSSFNTSILTATGRLREITWIQGASLIVGAILSTAGALTFGLAGAVAGLALRQWAVWPVGAAMMKRATGFPIRRQLNILALAGAPSIMMVLLLVLLDAAAFSMLDPLSRISALVAAGLLSYVSAWSFLNPSVSGRVLKAVRLLRSGRTSEAREWLFTGR
ncbi:MAG: lipopolysaccharide biosynthesis protein [Pseudomonadota bacterium]